MPGYEEHSRRAIQVGVASAVVVGAAAFYTTSAPVVAVVAAALTLAGARVGGNAPDIDSHSSIPRRYFDRSLQVLGGSVVVACGFVMYDDLLSLSTDVKAALAPSTPIPPVAFAVVAVVVAGVVAVVALPRVVGALMPSHRGVLHNPLLWIGIGGGLTAAGVGTLFVLGAELVVAAWVGGAIGGGLTAGALFAHLLPDGELI